MSWVNPELGNKAGKEADGKQKKEKVSMILKGKRRQGDSNIAVVIRENGLN